MEKQRGHYKLDDALIERAARLAALGWSHKAISEACGVSEKRFCEWLANGRNGNGTELECKLLHVFQEALVAGEETLATKIAQGDSRDAQWLLTHSARWRNNWSDGAATRREVNNALQAVVQVIQQSDLSPEQQDQILLRMQAAGLGAAA